MKETQNLNRVKLGQKLREERIRKGYSTTDVAKLIGGVTHGYISSYERGVVKSIQHETLLNFSKALDLPIETLYKILGSPQPEEVLAEENPTGLPFITDLEGRIRIGTILKRRREELKLSRDALASKMGNISRDYIVVFEKGKVKSIQPQRLLDFAKALDLPIEKLGTKEGQEEILQELSSAVDLEESVNIGRILKLKREMLHLSISKLAAKTKTVPQNVLAYYESGKAKKYNQETLMEISEALGIPFNLLCTRTGREELLKEFVNAIDPPFEIPLTEKGQGELLPAGEDEPKPKEEKDKEGPSKGVSDVMDEYLPAENNGPELLPITDWEERIRIGTILKYKREELNLSRHNLAAIMGTLGPNYIIVFERGGVKSLQPQRLQEFANALDLPFEKLFTREGQEELLEELNVIKKAEVKIADPDATIKIAKILKYKRELLHLSKKELSEKVKTVGSSTIGLYESERMKEYNPVKLEAVSEALGIPFDVLSTPEERDELLDELEGQWKPLHPSEPITDLSERKTIGKILRRKRVSLGMSVETLSVKMGKSGPRAINRLESGNAKSIPIRKLFGFAKALDLPLEKLLTEEGREELLSEIPITPLADIDEADAIEIGKALRHQRKTLGLSRASLGILMGMNSVFHIQRCESGKITSRGDASLQAIASTLGRPLEKLLSKEGREELHSTPLIPDLPEIKTPADYTIGKIIKAQRLYLKLSRPALADIVGLESTAYIQQLELGKNINFEDPKLHTIVDALELSLERMATEEGQNALLEEVVQKSHGILSVQTKVDAKRIGQILKLKRERLGISRASLSKVAKNISPVVIGACEKGAMKGISDAQIADLAKALDIPFEKLLTEEGQEELLQIEEAERKLQEENVQEVRRRNTSGIETAILPIYQTNIKRKPVISDYNLEKYPNCRYILWEGEPLYYMTDIVEVLDGKRATSDMSILIRMGLIDKSDVVTLDNVAMQEEFRPPKSTNPIKFGSGQWLEMKILKSLDQKRWIANDISLIPEEHRQLFSELLGKDIDLAPNFQDMTPGEFRRKWNRPQNEENTGETSVQFIAKASQKARHRKYNKEVGRRIKEAREKFQIPTSSLYRLMNWPNAASLNAYEAGELEDISINRLIDISEALRIPLVSLLGIEGGKAEDIQTGREGKSALTEKAKVVPILKSTYGDTYLQPNNTLGFEPVNDMDIEYGIIISDDSMVGARIYKGDVAFIGKPVAVQNGDIVLVKIERRNGTLRRYYNYGEEVILRPENPNMKEETYKLNQIAIIGKLKEIKFKV